MGCACLMARITMLFTPLITVIMLFSGVTTSFSNSMHIPLRRNRNSLTTPYLYRICTM